MIEFSVLIPVESNAGEAFPPAHDTVFEAFLLERFGAFTRAPGLYTGVWTSKGLVFRDSTRAYIVAVASVIDAGKFADVVVFAKANYEQEAIYLRFLGLSEVL